MTSRLRTLGAADRDAALSFLAKRPVENLFLTSKVGAYGIDRRRLGVVHAFERDGEITSLLLDGGTVFVAGFDPDALPAFVAELGPLRRCRRPRVPRNSPRPSVTASGEAPAARQAATAPTALRTLCRPGTCSANSMRP